MRLLKPCKVKRFLATAALSEVGLVTASSDPGLKQEHRTDTKKEGGKEDERLSKCGGIELKGEKKINKVGRLHIFQWIRQKSGRGLKIRKRETKETVISVVFSYNKSIKNAKGRFVVRKKE